MKQLIQVFIMVIATTTMFSQNSPAIEEEPTFYIFGAIDPKMAYEGPHGEGGVMNPEIGVGFNLDEKHRVWMGYEWLKEINYKKYTFIAFDRTFAITERLNLKSGIEFAVIYREKINPNDLRFGYEDDNFSFGLNGEIGYRISRTFEIYMNGSVFLAEPHDNFGNEMKKLRTDVRVGVNIIIFKIP